MMALTRDALLQKGVWFNEGAPFDEKCMKTGFISGGNALRLAEDLDNEKWHSVGQRLEVAWQRANGLGAHSVLLSSELLLGPLSSGNRLSRFTECLNAAGFSDAAFLLFLRDPVDHLISLYKHRAKRGTSGNMQEWSTSGYQLPEHLSGFRAQLDSSGINLSVRRYVRLPGALEKMFFEDWLGIYAPKAEVPRTVNASLTLSELFMIRQMAERKPELVKPLYNALTNVSGQQKAHDCALEAHARAIASGTVAVHAEEWAAWNKRLPKDEQLEIPDTPTEIPEPPPELVLSEQQMGAICELISEATTLEFIIRNFWRSRLRPALGRLKYTLLGPS
jgi:hypothetical protein